MSFASSFLLSFPYIFYLLPLTSHGFGFEHHASVPYFPNSSLSGVHPFPSCKHFPSYTYSYPTSAFCPTHFFFLLCFPLLPMFSFFCVYEKRTYKMTSKLQRKIGAVSKTAACTAVEGALDAVLFVRNKKLVNLCFCLAMRG